AAAAEAFAGEDEMKVSVGIGLVMLFPNRSITVGVSVTPPAALLATANDVLEMSLPICKLIDCTRHVSYTIGWLVTPETLAKIWVRPGTAPVKRAWVICVPLLLFNSGSVVLTLATVELVWIKLNEPTVFVMSIWLPLAMRKACA